MRKYLVLALIIIFAAAVWIWISPIQMERGEYKGLAINGVVICVLSVPVELKTLRGLSGISMARGDLIYVHDLSGKYIHFIQAPKNVFRLQILGAWKEFVFFAGYRRNEATTDSYWYLKTGEKQLKRLPIIKGTHFVPWNSQSLTVLIEHHGRIFKGLPKKSSDLQITPAGEITWLNTLIHDVSRRDKLIISPDAQKLAVLQYASRTLEVYDLYSGKRHDLFKNVRHAVWCPKSRLLVERSDGKLFLTGLDKRDALTQIGDVESSISCVTGPQDQEQFIITHGFGVDWRLSFRTMIFEEIAFLRISSDMRGVIYQRSLPAFRVSSALWLDN